MVWWTEQDRGQDFILGGLTTGGEVVLERLISQVARPGMLAFEIGCYTGWTAIKVLKIIKENNGHLYCVDWFRGSVGTVVGPFTWPLFESQRVLLQTLKNFELGGWEDDVSVTVARSRDLLPIIANGVADYIYIGADHRYSEVSADIVGWWPKLRSGGVLCGHAFSGDIVPGSEQWSILCAEISSGVERDYYNEYHTHFGVVRAVTELLLGYQAEHEIW